MFNEERIKDLEKSKSFVNKVRLCSQLDGSNNNMYKSFLILLAKCENKLICQEVYDCLKYDIFSDHPNLLKEFERLFMTETSEGINPNSFISSRHIIEIHAEGSEPRKVLEVEQNQCNIQDGNCVFPNLPKENIEKKIKFPMTRARFSSFETCTPSYQVLLKNCPENHPVLNNCVRLVAPNSSFRPPTRSEAEVGLDAVEDDLYMQDMFLEHLKLATKNVEELLNVLDETDQRALRTLPDPIKKLLTAQNLRCIENLYGEHGLDMIEALHVNPRKALDAILLRLKQKLRILGLN